MFCKRCRYSLVGLSTRSCPECGAEFNPADPLSFIADLRAWARRGALARVQLVCSVWPLAWLVFPYGTRMAMRLWGGEWTADAPAWVPWLHLLGYGSCCAFPLLLAGAAVLLFPLYGRAVSAGDRGWYWRRIALTLVCWVGAYLWITEIDPGSVIYWFLAPLTG